MALLVKGRDVENKVLKKTEAIKHMVLYNSAITINKERIYENKYKNSVNTTRIIDR